MAVELKWERICVGLERMSTSPSNPLRHTVLRSLLEDARACGDPFSVMRILLPKRDRVRAHFQLKESTLAACLVDALALARTSNDGRRLLSWKTRAGAMSGDLSLLACQVIGARQQRQPGELSLSNVHCYLDELSSSTTKEEKVSVLRNLIKHTTARQMKWIVRLILRDMRIGVGEKTVLKMFHPDANNVMSFCVDLQQVCVQLHSPIDRYRHQDIVVGKASKCQLAKQMNSIEEVWNLMKGKHMVAECKFDGDRMQLHKDGDTLHFFSRNGLEHIEYTTCIGPILQRHVTSKRCVLDGELLVWDLCENRYKPRTHKLNRDAARAARKGLESDDLICYVVFDILYEEAHGSIIHLPLNDRQELLKKTVTQVEPRFITVLPDDGSKWSRKPNSQEQLDQFFYDVVLRGDEGIVVKDLGSQWCPDKKDDRWCKIKPDYLNLGTDHDLLIIGGYFGKGQKAGQIVSYLLAVKDQIEHDEAPTKFLSICRCGVGLSEAEQTELQHKLGPHIVKNTKSGPPSDSGYMVAGSPYERPDFWISRPNLSMVLQVSAEKRVYRGPTFKVGFTFRFPRAVKVRYDKSWYDCLSIQELKEIIASAKERGSSMVEKRKVLPVSNKEQKYQRTRSGRLRSSSGRLVPEFFQGYDVSHIAQKSSQFLNLVFYVCKYGGNEMLENVVVRIIEAGGKVSLNLEISVTHIVSAQPKGLQYHAAVASGRDVISMEWLQECLDSSELLPITFRHYLHLSEATKEKQKEVVDCVGDSYFDDVTDEDLDKIFQKMENVDGQNISMDTILKVEEKYFGSWKWNTFKGITLYLLPPIHSMNVDSQTIARFTLKRLSLEVAMYGGIVVQVLNATVTHVIVFAPNTVTLSFKSIFRSIQASEQQKFLLCENVNVVSHLWLEDSVQHKTILPVAAYNLRSELVVGDVPASWKAVSMATKEEKTPTGSSQTKRQSVCELPPSTFSTSVVTGSPREQPTPDAQQFSSSNTGSITGSNSLDDFLLLLLPSLDSC